MPYKNIQDQKDFSRKNHLRKTYNISIEEYDKMLANQGGACKLCKCLPKHNWRPFHVDHNHKTGKIRGLLCRTCNRYIIGGIEKIGLSSIIDYLKK